MIKVSENPLSRRTVITGLISACSPLISPALSAGKLESIQRSVGGQIRKGKFLTLPQMRLLANIADIIVPRTQTAGASDLDVHGVIDDQLAHCQSPKQAQHFQHLLDTFSQLVKKHKGSEFHDLNPEQQIETVKALAENNQPFDKLKGDFFKKIKNLVVMAYYTSETGGSEELIYDPIPGGYDGHFKLSKNQDRAFSIYQI